MEPKLDIKIKDITQEISKSAEFELKAVDDDNLTLTFIASDESVDRHNDVILQSGWKFENFLKNPVFLQGHWSFDLPIGRVTNILVDPNNKQLVIDVKFSKSYSFSYTIYNLYKEKIMNSVSVGFKPLKWKWKDETPEDEWQWDPADRVFVEQELLEVSAVSIPANVNANIIRSMKGVDEKEKEKMVRDLKIQKAVDYYEKNQPILKGYHTHYEKLTDLLGIERGEDLQDGLDKVLLKVKDNLDMISYLKDNSEEKETPTPTETPKAELLTEEKENEIIQNIINEL